MLHSGRYKQPLLISFTVAHGEVAPIPTYRRPEEASVYGEHGFTQNTHGNTCIQYVYAILRQSLKSIFFATGHYKQRRVSVHLRLPATVVADSEVAHILIVHNIKGRAAQLQAPAIAARQHLG